MNLKSRKLIASGVIFGSATAAMFMGKMEAAEWMEASMMILGIYVGGNVGEHIANSFGKKK